jgi:hypothetical protein
MRHRVQRYISSLFCGIVLAVLAMQPGSAATDLRAVRAVAIHYGTFDLSDEPLSEPPLRFKEAAGDSSLGDGAAWTLNIGETREF